MIAEISRLRLDVKAQTRQSLDYSVVGEYAEALQAGAKFPPIEAVEDVAADCLWVCDGFHRVNAHMSAGLKEIEVRVVKVGTLDDAVWASAAANISHGLRRTNADKRRAVLAVLAVERFAEMSDRQIAEHCGVSHPFVAQLRPSGKGFQSATGVSDKENGKPRTERRTPSKPTEKQKAEANRAKTEAATAARMAKREEAKRAAEPTRPETPPKPAESERVIAECRRLAALGPHARFEALRFARVYAAMTVSERAAVDEFAGTLDRAAS